MLIDANVYGRPSLMMFDFKRIDTKEIYSEVIQRMMVVRRDATFFDISPEITMQAMEIAKTWDFTIPSLPIPPTRSGYMRMSIVNHEPLLSEDGQDARFNGILWQGDHYYMIHDPGGQSQVKFAPISMTVGLRGSLLRGDKPIFTTVDPADPSIPDFRNVVVHPMGSDVTMDMIRGTQTPMEEMLCLTHILFDMIAETKATTIVREQVRNPFGSKQRDYFETVRVVKISLNRCRAKYLKAWHEKTGRTNAWHEVRSHFRHRRVTKPDCQHRWIARYGDDDGKHYKCDVCGEIKTRVEFPNGAGDKTKGKIKHVYEVTG